MFFLYLQNEKIFADLKSMKSYNFGEFSRNKRVLRRMASELIGNYYNFISTAYLI